MSKLKKGDIVVSANAVPYMRPINVRNNVLSMAYPDLNYTNALNGGVSANINSVVDVIKFTSTGRHTLIGMPSAPYFVIKDNLDFSTIPHSIPLTDSCSNIALSNDGLWIAIGGDENKVFILNAADFTLHTTLTLSETYYGVTGLAFHPDSGTLIVSITHTPYLLEYSTSDFTITAKTFTVPDDNNGIEFLDNTNLIVKESYYTRIVDVTTGLVVASRSELYNRDAAVVITPDKSRLASFSGSVLVIRDAATLTELSTFELRDYAYSLEDIVRAAWLDNISVVTTHADASGIQIINTETGDITSPIDNKSCVSIAVMHTSNYIQEYKVTGTIADNTLNDNWLITAYDDVSGVELSQIDFVGDGDFELFVPSSDNVMVTVRQPPMVGWEHSTNYAIGDLTVATNPSANPYYYRCTTAGISGASEPTWNNVQSSSTVDGAATWVTVERLIEPKTHSPLKPVPV